MSSNDNKVSVLSEVIFFRGLPLEDLHGLASIAVFREFKRDTVLFEYSDPGNSLFILGSGKVRMISPGGVTFIAGEPRLGPDLMTEHTKVGSIFGEMAFIDRHPRSAGAVINKGSNLLELNRDEFNRVALGNSRAALTLMIGLAGLVSTYLRSANSEITFLRNFVAQRYGIAIDTMNPGSER